jgi:hypothetical protein
MPREAVTETFAVLANKGKGKSNTATVIVEQLYHQQLPVVVLDVKGDWWGLRSSRDGKSKGLPFVIFGGDHADVPLEATAGTLMADLIVDRRIPCVLDMSHMSKTKARSFATDFAERLYFRNRESLMVVIDEADVLIPQRASADTARLLGAMEDIAKRGRGRGLGLTVITQRPQEIAKSVLELCETVFLLGMTGTRSIKAVKEWIEVNADDENTTVIGSLPKLEVGEAWIWSPAFLKTLQRVHINLCETFDSHKTPEPGKRSVSPTMATEVDLDALGAEIAATVERAKENDPRELKRRIQALQGDVAMLQQQVEAAEQHAQMAEAELASAEQAIDSQDNCVDLPTVEEVRSELKGFMEDFSSFVKDLGVVLAPWQLSIVDKVFAGEKLNVGIDPSRQKQQMDRLLDVAEVAGGRLGGIVAKRNPFPTSPPARTRGSGDSDVKLGKTERSVLTVLVTHGVRTQSQIAMQAGYSPKSSTVSASLSKLRKMGYVTLSGPIMATPEGVEALGEYEELPSGPALLKWWQTRLGKTENALLTHLLDIYEQEGPSGFTNNTIASEACGYSPSSSTISASMSKLRKLEIAAGWGLNPVFADAIEL